MRCVGVPEVVKSDTRKVGRVDKADPFVGDERRLHRGAVGERGDEIVIGQTGSELEHVLSLLEPVGAEFIANRP